jgi:hypothetical protein
MFRVVNENMRALNEAFAALTDTYTIARECYDRLHRDDPDWRGGVPRSARRAAPVRRASWPLGRGDVLFTLQPNKKGPVSGLP